MTPAVENQFGPCSFQWSCMIAVHNKKQHWAVAQRSRPAPVVIFFSSYSSILIVKNGVLDCIYNEGLVGPSKYQKAQLGRISTRGKYRRTMEEFRCLLENAGLKVVQVQKSDEFGHYDAVWAKKACKNFSNKRSILLQ